MGMKKEGKKSLKPHHGKFRMRKSLFLSAVQKERDRLGHQRPHHHHHHHHPYKVNSIKCLEHLHGNDDDEDDLSIETLLRAEQTAKEV